MTRRLRTTVFPIGINGISRFRGSMLGGKFDLGVSSEASWGVLGASEGVLEASWGILGPSWSVLETSWRRLEASWRRLGGVVETP